MFNFMYNYSNFYVVFMFNFMYCLSLGSTFIGLPKYNPFLLDKIFQIQIKKHKLPMRVCPDSYFSESARETNECRTSSDCDWSRVIDCHLSYIM